MKYNKTTLKNGLQVLTVPMTGTKTATIVILVGVGSRFEKDKQAGLSHFIEHMMFKGTKKRPMALDISSELDAIGGEYNAFTGKDLTAYYVKVDAKHIGKAMDVVADMFFNSKIEKEEIKRERGTIIQEFNMYEDSPMKQVANIFEEVLYPKNGLGRAILGTKKAVASFSRKDFMSYMKKHYVAANTVVCVAGKIKEKETIKQIKDYFSKSKRGNKSAFSEVKEAQKKPAVKIKNKKTDQTHLSLGVRAFGYHHKDRFALTVLATILGGNMSSRMFIEVRERRGLAYFVKTFFDAYSDCGYLTTQASVDHKKIKLAAETILKEYQKITKKKVTEEELKKAKEYLKGKMIMNFESSDEVAVFFVEQMIREKNIKNLEEVISSIEAVTVDDIFRVAQNIFKSERLNLAIIGPQKNKKELENILKL